MSPVSPHFPQVPIIPEGVNFGITATFRRQIINVTGSIFLFLFVYLLLIMLSIALAIGAVVGGVYLLSIYLHFVTVALAIGSMFLGAMVVYFLFKSMVVDRADPNQDLMELEEKDQPELFAFIRKLAEETHTSFPKHIFISHDVNASVSFDSSFYSIFFSSGKNLTIGAGLVNSLNISEFTAVLAHEFGHFSQRSMKFGSYVYHLNQVIYNIIYNNKNYDELLQQWAQIHSYFALFAQMTAGLVSGIQLLMQRLYPIINKNYLSLSRQMEFHADSVAARITGSQHPVDALYRIEFASSCYDQLFGFYGVLAGKNLRPVNMYSDHFSIMTAIAVKKDITLLKGFPHITASAVEKMGVSRIVVKDQWASHPSTMERELHLNNLNINAVSVVEPAWNLFHDAGMLQAMLTDKVFDLVTFKELPTLLSPEGFKLQYDAYMDENNYQPYYKGYYDHRSIVGFDVRGEAKKAGDLRSAEIFSDYFISLPNRIRNLNDDLAKLNALKSQKDIKSIDFDGEKYPVKELADVERQVVNELTAAEQELNEHDKIIFCHFAALAAEQSKLNELIVLYENIFKTASQAQHNIKLYDDIIPKVNMFFSPLSSRDIKHIIKWLAQREEALRLEITNLLETVDRMNADYQSHIPALETYLENEYTYFNGTNYDDDSLAKLTKALSSFGFINAESLFRAQKKAYQFQLDLLPG